MTMNSIDEIQNKDTSLQKLAAQRRAYSEAKRIFFIRSISAICVAIAFPWLSESLPNLKNWFTAAAVLYIAVDFLLKKVESEKRTDGAKIQEAFDCEVYGLRWNFFAAGGKPDGEVVGSYFVKVQRLGFESLKNWYPNNLSELPVGVARTICQRANIWWDSGLRIWYARLNLIILIVLSICMLWVNKDKTVASSIIFFASFVPLFKLLLEEYISHTESAKRLTELKQQLNDQLDSVLTGGEVDEYASRSIQDEIFRHRNSVTSIPNWFYGLLKNRYEKLMGFNAQEYVSKYTSTKVKRVFCG